MLPFWQNIFFTGWTESAEMTAFSADSNENFIKMTAFFSVEMQTGGRFTIEKVSSLFRNLTNCRKLANQKVS